jgi:hypothetical protein
MKRIRYVRKGLRVDPAELRKANKARIRQLKMAVHFANKVLEHPKLKARYELLAKERNFRDAYTAAMSIFLNTEASLRSSLRRIKEN